MKPYLGIDIGGTNIKIATVSATAEVVDRGLIETRAPEGAARAFARIHAAAQALGKGGIEAVGIGCAGLFDERRGVLTASPNLKAWEGSALARLAAKHFSVPVLIQNDATVAGYGESVVRGTRGRNLVLITLGTGVGGGIVMDGQIVRGVTGFGGEIGHITVNPKGPKCHCGRNGCLEAYVGSYGIVRTANELRRASRGRRAAQDEKLTAYLVFDRASAGDRWARETVRVTGEYLGIAIAILLNTLNPSVIVLGGGVSASFKALEPHIRRSVRRYAFPEMIAAARIERARLGNDAGMVGAAMLVRDAITKRRN
ncbi:MAG TPA: ROK family protein [Candidatus Krumholzibacteria bacterium]|nr:ROK family protein [Candidatus Krumholzibacteria bacterium]